MWQKSDRLGPKTGDGVAGQLPLVGIENSNLVTTFFVVGSFAVLTTTPRKTWAKKAERYSVRVQ